VTANFINPSECFGQMLELRGALPASWVFREHTEN
jgi:hypothetical protein